MRNIVLNETKLNFIARLKTTLKLKQELRLIKLKIKKNEQRDKIITYKIKLHPTQEEGN